MKRAINVSFDCCQPDPPFVIIEESPLTNLGVFITPEQLRDIAAVLRQIAGDSEALGSNPGGKRRSYQVWD